MTKQNKKLKKLIKEQRGRVTFRTLINICKDHTSFGQKFYANNFNKKGAQERARERFAEARKNSKGKKKRKKSDTPETKNTTVIEDINEALRGFDLSAPSSAAVMVSVVKDLLPQVEDKGERLVVEKQIRQAFKLSKPEFAELKRVNLRQKIEDEGADVTALEVDLIQKVTAAYKKHVADKDTDHSVIYTMGNFYNYNKRARVYRKLAKETVNAHLYNVVVKLTDSLVTDQAININHIQAEALKRVQAEFNGEVIFNESDLTEKFNKSRLRNIGELNTGHTDLFTNVINAQVASGDVYMYMNNAQVVYRTQSKNKKIGNTNIRRVLTGEETIEQLLSMPEDLENHKIGGLLEVDHERHGLYYNAKMPANFMSNKETLKALRSGGAKRFVHFLDCVTANLKPMERAEFITAYLDILAYLMQPVKRHNCFFYFYGLGENGKSFGMNILQACCGKTQIAKRPLETANENPRFFASSLHSINAAYDDDIQTVSAPLVGMLKKYSNGNDVVTAELKGSNEPLEFLLRCSMVLLSNKKLSIKDSTKGLSRRLYALNFGVDISVRFDRYKHGVPLLEKEVDVIYNLLRLRIPRVVKQGVQHTPAMAKETHAITNKGILAMAVNKLKPKRGSDILVRDLLTHVKAEHIETYGADSIPSRDISIEELTEALTQRGHTINVAKGLVKNVKIKKRKKSKK